MKEVRNGTALASGRAVWRSVQGSTGLSWPVDVHELCESSGRFLAVRPPDVGSLLSVRFHCEGLAAPIVRLLQPLAVERKHGAWLVWGRFTEPLTDEDMRQLSGHFLCL